jgi:PEGA domain
MRGLCMEEAIEPEKNLRDQILQKLLARYRTLALASWFGLAIVWSLVGGLPSNFQISWWFILGLIPLLLGIQWFAEDFGVRFSGPKDRILPTILFSIAAFLSGIAIGDGTSWIRWIGLVLLIVSTCVLGLIRSKARAKLKKIEAYFTTFPNPQALESYVLKFDPKHEFFSKTIYPLVFLVVLLSAQPAFYLVKGINSWALDRTKIQFSVQIDGKIAQATPEILFNGKPIHSGDQVPPGKGIIEVTDISLMPFRNEMRVSYGRVANAGTIELTPAHGKVTITSDPPDAEFQLVNQSHAWIGNLPFQTNIPTGDYQLITRRKGWELDTDISVVRGGNTTNKIEFSYGSIDVTSDPAGLAVSTNGVEIGKTPMILQEVIPGQYTLTVSDGENDLTADVNVAPKEAAKHAFVFHYGTVQLSSMPTGATVIRKGKEIGKTPLTFNHIPAGETTIALQLQDYASTNFSIQAVEGATTDLSVKLISERYVQAMKQAREALDADQFEQASNSVAAAIQSDPTDSNATSLLAEITSKTEVWKQQQLAAEQSAADEKSRAKAAEFAAIPVLDPLTLINTCWNPANHEATDNVNRAVAAPVEVALNVVLSPLTIFGKATGQKGSSVKDANTSMRFNMGQFYENWKGRTFSYKGIVESVQTKGKIIVFKQTGSYPRAVCVAVSLTQESVDEWQKLKKNDALTVIGEISSLSAPEVMTLGVNSIVLQNGRIYRETLDDSAIHPPDNSSATADKNNKTAESSISANTLFSDSFNENFVNPAKWTTSGNTVIATAQTVQVLTTVTDAGGSLTSWPFPVRNTGLISVTRRVFLHHNNNYFAGRFGVKIGSLPMFSIQYVDMDYADGKNLQACHGFFITRNDSSAIYTSSQGDITAPITPLWDEWFDEMLTYDPALGLATYYINNIKQCSFNVGILPETNSPTMTLSFTAWGWYTGHEQSFKDLMVTQTTGTP